MTMWRSALALTIGWMFALAGCEREPHTAVTSSGSVPPAAAAATKSGAPPQIAFEATELNLGTISEVEKRTARFHFTNTGGRPLVIESVKTSCSCTAAKLDKSEYAPGESGEIDITYSPTGPGNNPQIVNVISNAEPDSFMRLTVHANVVAFLDIQPRMLQAGVLAHRQEHRFEVTVRCPPDENFAIESITTSNPNVLAHLLPPSPGSSARTIRVTVLPSAPWGNLFSWLEIAARGRPTADATPISHTSRIRIQGQVFGKIRAEPDTFRFGAKPGEAFERRISLTHADGRAFEVRGAQVTACDLPNTTVQVRRINDSTVELILRAVGDRLRPQAVGSVAVLTNVPGEERLEIPIAGAIRNEPAGVR